MGTEPDAHKGVSNHARTHAMVQAIKRGYNHKQLGISKSKHFRYNLKSRLTNFIDSYETQYHGSSFDTNYDKIRKKLLKQVSAFTV